LTHKSGKSFELTKAECNEAGHEMQFFFWSAEVAATPFGVAIGMLFK